MCSFTEHLAPCLADKPCIAWHLNYILIICSVYCHWASLYLRNQRSSDFSSHMFFFLFISFPQFFFPPNIAYFERGERLFVYAVKVNGHDMW